MEIFLLLILLSTFPTVLLGFTQTTTTAFRQRTGEQSRSRRSHLVCTSSTADESSATTFANTNDEAAPLVDAVVVDPEVMRLQKELLQLATSTNRGFTASPSDRRLAKELIFDLANYNPTAEPASPFYNSTSASIAVDSSSSPTLAGKWTLVYTDAPDVTGLDTSNTWLPLTAKLGRIGQECNPPYIKNVIEWRRPDWAAALPFSGTDQSRVLQKVVTEATATPDKPLSVDLQLAGIEIVGVTTTTEDDSLATSSSFEESVQEDGFPAAWFKQNPIELKGPLTAPFGQFEILYLDDQFRIIKTGQDFLAVNVRNELDWF